MSAADLSPGRDSSPSVPQWRIARFGEIPAVACPCGMSRRAFADEPSFAGTIHQVEISTEARLHYHKTLTETYYILECGPGAQMQLDDEIIDVSPGTCILIPPGVRHRALGEMRVLNIVLPKFDPADEWFDEPE